METDWPPTGLKLIGLKPGTTQFDLRGKFTWNWDLGGVGGSLRDPPLVSVSLESRCEIRSWPNFSCYPRSHPSPGYQFVFLLLLCVLWVFTRPISYLKMRGKLNLLKMSTKKNLSNFQETIAELSTPWHFHGRIFSHPNLRKLLQNRFDAILNKFCGIFFSSLKIENFPLGPLWRIFYFFC